MSSMDNFDVIVIGAGAAGLAAASRLGSAGLSTLVIEARERIGGRMFTQRDPVSQTPVELGAEFIHGRPPEILIFLKPTGPKSQKSEETVGAAGTDRCPLATSAPRSMTFWEKWMTNPPTNLS